MPKNKEVVQCHNCGPTLEHPPGYINLPVNELGRTLSVHFHYQITQATMQSRQGCPTYSSTPVNGSFPESLAPVTPMSASFDLNDLPPRPGAPTPLTSLYGSQVRPNGQPTPLETPTEYPNLMTMSLRGPVPGFIEENDPEA